MRDDVLVLLSTSIAISIPQDEVAFEMLHIDFIRGFKQFYNETCVQRRQEGRNSTPVVLDEMIKYTIDTLSQKCPDSESLYILTSTPVMIDIKRRFMTNSLPEMITALAKRDLVKQTIRTFLHGKDRFNNHTQIDSTRFDGIFADFISYFRDNSSGTFRFDGSFEEFMCHCFVHFFYQNKKRDIWRDLRAVDHAKREAETSIGTVKMLTQDSQDNVRIGEFIRNIIVLNDRMFYHSGQSEDVKGVCYDVYYLILNYLCKQRVAQINNGLDKDGITDYKVQFIDERDRHEKRVITEMEAGVMTRVTLDANKSISSKINNAWDLVPYLFECVRSGDWSFDNIVELRDQCFLLGKKDREGKNCIWRDVFKGAETARYFDMPNASSNYIAYDVLFKGVLSVLSLMKALEGRNMYLVDTYPIIKSVIEDKNIARVIEYIDDLDYVDRIRSLQKMAQQYPQNTGDLRQFKQMVHDYAGSVKNDRPHIRKNRYEAITHGLLDNPRLKQKGVFQTEYDKLKSVAEFMTAIPRSYDEYVYKVYSNDQLTFRFAAPGRYMPDYVLIQKYATLYYNKFFTSNPDLADYYLYKINSYQHSGDGQPARLDSMEWHLCTALTPYVHLTQRVTERGDETYDHYYALYVPVAREFMLIPMGTEVGRKVSCHTVPQLQKYVMDTFFNGRHNAFFQMRLDKIPSEFFESLMFMTRDGRVEVNTALSNSIGFDTLFGLINLDSSAVATKISRIPVADEYIAITKTYYSWLCDLTTLQNAFVELLWLMLTYAVYNAKSDSQDISPDNERNGLILFHSLLRCEFHEDNLSWFFNALESSIATGKLDKVDYSWGKNLPQAGELEFTQPDLLMFRILKGEISADQYPTVTLMNNFIRSLDAGMTMAEKFVYAYNYLACKFAFIRILRDAYDITLNVVGGYVATLGCELDSRFHIRETLQNAKAAAGTGGMLDIRYALLDNLSLEQITGFVGNVRMHNWQTYSVLCDGLIHYIDTCHTSLSSLVDYEIGMSQEAKSKFSQWGGLFEATGPYNHPVVMSNLGIVRSRARRDDAGFLLLKNSYLCAQLGDASYYIHSTGRILTVTSSGVTPAVFNFDNPEDARLYGDIVNDAKRRCAW